jgi:hypothetical protein
MTATAVEGNSQLVYLTVTWFTGGEDLLRAGVGKRAVLAALHVLRSHHRHTDQEVK